jgi:hypothetical protein
MSMPPMNSRPGTNGASGEARFASTSWPTRVRLQPRRAVCKVTGEDTWRYSAVVNWLVETKARGNCGKSVGRCCSASSSV